MLDLTATSSAQLEIKREVTETSICRVLFFTFQFFFSKLNWPYAFAWKFSSVNIIFSFLNDVRITLCSLSLNLQTSITTLFANLDDTLHVLHAKVTKKKHVFSHMRLCACMNVLLRTQLLLNAIYRRKGNE